VVAAQPSLFADEELAPKAYVPNPQHVRNRLQSMLDKMRAGAAWPWDSSTVRFYRETVWPYLYAKLPDTAEAARWRTDIDVEAVRLDAAQEQRVA
jgi:hypothetical protein